MSLDSKSLPNGQEQYEYYDHLFIKGKKLCQYDYRDDDGELFSCVAPTLEKAHKKREAWLNKKAGNEKQHQEDALQHCP